MTLRRTMVLALLLGAAACDTPDPTSAVVENAYPLTDDPRSQTVIYETWWAATLFADPVAAGAASEQERSVPETGFAYALLAPRWDPASGTPPARLVVARSKEKLAAPRGDTLHIVVSDATFAGNCAVGQPLSQEEADFITQRIFPGAFAGTRYDAKTCISTPIGDAAARD